MLGGEEMEPNSDGLVLRNYLSITSKTKIELIEAQELDRMEIEIMELFDEDHQLTAQDICNIHSKVAW